MTTAGVSHNGSQWQAPDKTRGRGPRNRYWFRGRGPLPLRPQRSARSLGYYVAEARSSVVGEASASAVTLSLVERASSCG